MAASSASDRVLIADPDPNERQRLIRIVRAAAEATGHAVETVEAADGPAALSRWNEKTPRLVICEVLLQGVSGLALLRRMNAERQGHVPVILVTSMARQSDRYWGLRNGAHAYVPKPYDEPVLQTRIEQLLQHGAEATRQRPLE